MQIIMCCVSIFYSKFILASNYSIFKKIRTWGAIITLFSIKKVKKSIATSFGVVTKNFE